MSPEQIRQLAMDMKEATIQAIGLARDVSLKHLIDPKIVVGGMGISMVGTAEGMGWELNEAAQLIRVAHQEQVEEFLVEYDKPNKN